MQLKHIANTPLPIKQNTQWLLFSEKLQSFITGDDKAAFALPITNPSSAEPIESREIDSNSACNLPVTDELTDELLAQPWRGFQFLSRSDYDHAPAGDILRTLVFSPDYGTLVRHPASGAILGLHSKSIELFERDGDGFKSIEKAKTKGKVVLAYAAHPTEQLIAYGDNFGVFHLHTLMPTGLGKATKLVDKTRNANRIEFVRDGKTIILGGMGYLSALIYKDGKAAPLHDAAVSVRDFSWHADGKLIVVNQGLHGVSIFSHDESGFAKLADATPDGPVHQTAVSTDLRFVAFSRQDSACVGVYAIEW